MNYYKVHKNKKPKPILKQRTKKYVSLFPLKYALISANSAVQIRMIEAQPKGTLSNVEKATAIKQILEQNLSNVPRLIKEEKQRKFQLTKRYVK